jgi:hypothetical protein
MPAPDLKKKTSTPDLHRPVVLAPRPLELPATLTTSKNRLINDLAACIHKYNFLFRTFDVQKRASAANGVAHTLDATGVALLDRMSLLCLTYLAAKPPGGRKETGKKKWDSIVAFTDQLQAHANYFNIKLLAGDFSGRPEGGTSDQVNYWLERLDPDNNAVNQWEQFVFWLGREHKNAFVGDSADNAEGLEYLNEVDRERYRVTAINGRVCYEGGEPLDTSGGSASYSEAKGVYIYVCSARTKKVYTFNSVLKQMHHSSFLRGEPVLGAGCWQVIQGEVRYVDGQSGHYKPSFEQIRTFAQACQPFWNPRTIVMPWFDRKHDATLMRNLIQLGNHAPVLRASPSLDVPFTKTPEFRHTVKPHRQGLIEERSPNGSPSTNLYINHT